MKADTFLVNKITVLWISALPHGHFHVNKRANIFEYCLVISLRKDLAVEKGLKPGFPSQGRNDLDGFRDIV